MMYAAAVMCRVPLVAVGILLLGGGDAWGASASLRGGAVRTVTICGAVRHAVAAGPSARIVARGARRLRVERCAGGRRWVRAASVRGGRPVPRLSPGSYRVRAHGLMPAYLYVKALPLLDRSAVRAPMVAFCEHRSDATPLPVDPRRLVNANLKRTDLATYFNASWIDLHNAPGFRAHPVQHPTTCGGFREWVDEGRAFVRNRPFFALLASTKAYDNLWRVWGLPSKPADFEQQVVERYGLAAAPFRNPYPLPGEDANKTDGGSGQLPLGLIQGRDKNTNAYNGKVTITCSACHDSQLGTNSDGIGLRHGRGSDGVDASLIGAELGRAAQMVNEAPEPGLAAAGALPFPYSAGRGVTNAFGLLDWMAAGFDMETLDPSPGVEFFPDHGAAGQVQTPNWWNRSHRTRMFWGGELSGDNARVSMALAVAQTERTGPEIKALEPNFERVHVFFDSLSPPPYPKPVDTKLAERGAVLFHTKDLRTPSKSWPGNGSCASCHGVYSPRYAADPKFLPDPRLKGIEANITPLDVIGTDPARSRIVNDQFKRAWNTSWWGYDELNPKWTAEGQGRRGTTFERALYDYGVTKDRWEGPNKWSNDPVGYEAPPLYGIWASAPYFHNGSVPTVRGVLEPKARPDIWRRPFAKPGIGGLVQGFDTSFAAYDFNDLGYRYTKIACSDSTVPCQPHGSPLSVVEGKLSNTLGPQVFLGNQVPPPMTEEDRQRRMIYNTHEYSMGNGGHDFMSRLSDDDVNALLEFMKTL